MHADELDRAADLTAAVTQGHVEDIRHRARPEQVQNPDGSWPHTECVECGNEIPEGRLILGKIRCVHCQRLLEAKRSGRL